MVTSNFSSSRAWGLALIVVAAALSSTAGLAVREIETPDMWAVLLLRSGSFVLVLLTWIVLIHGKQAGNRFVSIGRVGAIAAIALATAFISYIHALRLAPVASVVAVTATMPILAGLLGWWFLSEQPSRVSWLTAGMAMIGVILAVSENLAAGSAAGMVFAIGACAGTAAGIVAMRSGRAKDMTPAIAMAGVLAMLASVCLMGAFSLSTRDVIICLFLGVFQLGVPYLLLIKAARSASPADIAVVMLVEVILAPLWVWLALGEGISVITLLGGGIILIAAAWNALAGAPRQQAKQSALPTPCRLNHESALEIEI